MKSKYSLLDCIRLLWSLFLTKTLFTNARIIRQPTRIRGFKFIKLGHGFTTGQYCRIEADSKCGESTLIIGDNVQINDRCHIAAIDCVEIGNNVLIASNVYISDHDHGDTSYAHLSMSPSSRPLISKPVRIADNVWVGENAVILKGVTIGESAIVAAGAVVTKSVPPFCVVAGIPAKVIRHISDC